METKIHSVPRVGYINGLAVYGPNTGALLEIEATVIPSKENGSIMITGIVEEESIGSQTKSIRRKSLAKSSIDNVLTVLRRMGVPANNFDIHINFPGGAPVDGPSAGIAIATAIYSAIKGIEVDNTIAMTGEISIHGKVKPVGGVFAKITAASQAGAKTVFVPKENQQSILKEIKGIEIRYVEHLDEVFEQVFKGYDHKERVDEIVAQESSPKVV
jgi:Lon-like ATP-dependent protease